MEEVAGRGAPPSQPPARSTPSPAAPDLEPSASATAATASTPVDRPSRITQPTAPAQCTHPIATHTATAPARNDSALPNSARRSKFTVGAPSRCTRCSTAFPSRNQLFKHLQSCKTQHPVTSPAPPASAPASRKRARSSPPELPPSTFDDAAALPPAKRRHFIHQGVHQNTQAVQAGGMTFYNTAPPAYDPALEHSTRARLGLL